MGLSHPDHVERFHDAPEPVDTAEYLDEYGILCRADRAVMIRLCKPVGKGRVCVVVELEQIPALAPHLTLLQGGLS